MKVTIYLSVAAISLILMSSGCLFSRVDEQEVSIQLDGLLEFNTGYVLIPALLYGFKGDDIRAADISEKIVQEWDWTIEEISGVPFMNISIRYEIDLNKKIKDPEPAYFRVADFDTDADFHQIPIYLDMETPQNMTVSLYSLHSDDYHWFSSEATGFIGQGWNSISVFYSLEES